MPTTPLIPTNAPVPAALPALEQGLFEAPLRAMLVALFRAVTTLIEIVSGRLSMGQGLHGQVAGYLDAQWLWITLPDRNVAHAVPHGLGRVPAGFTIWKLAQATSGGAAPPIYPVTELAWTEEVIWVATSSSAFAGVPFLILLT
jgi:hypothetical protein